MTNSIIPRAEFYVFRLPLGLPCRCRRHSTYDTQVRDHVCWMNACLALSRANKPVIGYRYWLILIGLNSPAFLFIFLMFTCKCKRQPCRMLCWALRARSRLCLVVLYQAFLRLNATSQHMVFVFSLREPSYMILASRFSFCHPFIFHRETL